MVMDLPLRKIEDFNNSYLEMKNFYKEIGKEFVEATFDFKYDITF